MRLSPARCAAVDVRAADVLDPFGGAHAGRVRPLTFALNAVFLLLVCLIPFSTAMVSSNPNKDSVVAFMHTIVSITAFSLLLVALSLHRQRALVRCATPCRRTPPRH